MRKSATSFLDQLSADSITLSKTINKEECNQSDRSDSSSEKSHSNDFENENKNDKYNGNINTYVVSESEDTKKNSTTGSVESEKNSPNTQSMKTKAVLNSIIDRVEHILLKLKEDVQEGDLKELREFTGKIIQMANTSNSNNNIANHQSNDESKIICPEFEYEHIKLVKNTACGNNVDPSLDTCILFGMELDRVQESVSNLI